jgi:hypothetical protein
VRRAPLPRMLRTTPEPLAVILGGVGDCVDSFGAGFLPRQCGNTCCTASASAGGQEGTPAIGGVHRTKLWAQIGLA